MTRRIFKGNYLLCMFSFSCRFLSIQVCHSLTASLIFEFSLCACLIFEMHVVRLSGNANTALPAMSDRWQNRVCGTGNSYIIIRYFLSSQQFFLHLDLIYMYFWYNLGAV